uniref:Tyr recombinase domain-containing protein n=1 Tax=Photinus pyralis TaxID=7054 RepID=A0A1Y1N2Y1_PHOPY
MLRPTKPKYDNIWDPAVVLDYLRGLKNSEISIDTLTHKLTALLALATGQRLQTLTLIEISNIYRDTKGLTITIPSRIKTSGRNRLQPVLRLPFLDLDPEICVARTVLLYINKTEVRRGSVRFLILSTRKPFHKATAQTLSRWIKIILQKSGVDVTKFSAYSTRHAATSAASRKGLNFDTIRLSAGWSQNSNMFATVYNRPICSDKSFAETVLGD